MRRRSGLMIACGGAALAMLLVAARSVAQNAPGDDDVILKAMRDEMERSRQLRVVGGQDVPYFFSYDLTDSENLHITASMGSVLNVNQNHLRIPAVEVRVGSYDFDNTDHVYSGIYGGTRYDQSWPLDDNYNALRESLWLATDRTYKAGLESMGRKKASLNNAAKAESLPDFSKADPVVSLPKVTHKKVDEAAWSSRMAKISAILNSYPEVLSSGLDLQVIDGITWLVNSEGTSIRYADNISWVTAKGEGQAPDGMLMHDALSIQALDLDKLPPETEIRRAVTEMADNVRALVKAPKGESYSGPTLFEPRAAAQLLAQLVGDNLRVPRRPQADPGRNVPFAPSEFESRLNARVLPEWMDVTDDPTQMTWNNKPLVGWYAFDLEGVAPKAVPVIEKGMLKSFLTTRQPVRGFPASNGHARLAGGYGARSAAIGNLFVKARETASMGELKKRMIQMLQDRGKPYGMLVRKLDYPFSGTTGDLQGLAQASAQSGGSARPVSPPLLVYRVYPDGREELVRGLRFRGVSSRTLRDILAASEETALFDYVNNGAPLALLGAGGYLAAASVVSPGLLFDELEFELPQDQLPRPAVVPPPNVGN